MKEISLRRMWTIRILSCLLVSAFLAPGVFAEEMISGVPMQEEVRIFSEQNFGPGEGQPDQSARGRFREMSREEKLDMFLSLSPSEQQRVFEGLTDSERSALILSMDPADRDTWSQRYPGLVSPSGVTGGQEGAFTGFEPQAQPETDERKPQAPTPIERMLSGRFPRDITRELEQFGYDYFERNGSRFSPVGHIPVGENYVIGPGDSFTVHLWGRVEAGHEVVVSRDGSITLPRVGTLDVGGLRFSELKPFLRHKFSQIYPDFEMSVTMGTLRSMDVFLMGEAEHPGTYSVSALSTALTTLFQAGGPNKIGSLRSIRVLRDGKQVGELDLYDFFIKGSRSADVRLQPGDTIFVPVIGPVVGIAGLVKRPGIYEMAQEQSLGEMVALAGGVLAAGHLQNVVVERVVGHQRRVVRSFDLAPGEADSAEVLDLPLQDGDVVKVYPVHEQLQQVVYLEGHVKYPREYELKPGMRLLDLIPSYDELLPEPYLEQAEVVRLVPPDLKTEVLLFDLGALLEGDQSQNLELQNRDRVIVYNKWEKEDRPEVRVAGAVRNPSTYRLFEGMTVRDLVFRAGNLTARAYTRKATLVRVVTREEGAAETTKIEFSLRDALRGGDEEENLLLKKDDILYVRSIPEYDEALERSVTLEGEFPFPGEYAFSRGERLADVVTQAGGLTEDAYARGAVFERESVKKLQRERLDQYIDKLEEDILSMGALSAEGSISPEQAGILTQALSAKRELLRKLRQSEVTGRMVVDLEQALAIPSSDDNLELRAGDRLVIKKRSDTVNVMGEVYNPMALFVQKDKSVGYYLDRVGGVTKDAEEDEIYVVRADGTVMSKSQRGFFGMATWDGGKHRWTLGGFESIPVEPGDTIIVPRKVERYPWMRVAKDLTQIVYQVALAAGVWLTHF